MKNRKLIGMMVACMCVLPLFGQVPKLKPLNEKELLETLKPGEKKGTWGYVNDEGKFLIKNIFSEARPYNRDIAIVRYGTKYGILDKTGVFILEPAYDEMKDFHGVYSRVRQGSVWGTIGRDGKVITPPQFDKCEYRRPFEVLLVTKDGRIGAVDSRGLVSVEPVFSMLNDVKDGVAIVLQNGKMGAVDLSLRIMVEPKYDILEYTGSGEFYAKNDGKVGIVSYTGDLKNPIEYDDIQFQEVGKYYLTTRDGKYGLISPTNKEILAPVLKEKPQLHSGNNLIEQDGVLYLVSERGASWWSVDKYFDLSRSASLSMSDTLTLQTMPLGTEMLLIYHDSNPYFISKAGRVVWAANADIKQWAESPINFQLNCENVSKKGYITAMNEAKKPVVIEQSFDLRWPVSALDPRVDVALCQQVLIDCMQRKLFGESSTLAFDDIDAFLTYATTHVCKGEGLTNVQASAKPKGKNMNEGGYTMSYTGCFVGDETIADATYNFQPNIMMFGSIRPQNEPEYVHFSKETGVPFTLKDRYSLSAQGKMVSMIRAGNVVCDTPEEKEAFNSLRDACADVDENFYVKGDLVYFYKHPFYSSQPMHIGVRQASDVLAGSTGKKQSFSEYVFTSFDLGFFDLHDHVEKMSFNGSSLGNHTYRFNLRGDLIEIDGNNPFAENPEEGVIHMERDKKGLLKKNGDAVDASDAYQYLEYDTHGNWTKRKLKQAEDGAEETRTITYY